MKLFKIIWAWLMARFKKVPVTPEPPAPTPDPEPPQPDIPLAVKLPHGEVLGSIPESIERKEHIYHIPPFSDVRFLCLTNDCFINELGASHFRVENGYAIADDFLYAGIVFVFDHFCIERQVNQTKENPWKIANSKGTFRVWWRAYAQIS